MAAEVRNRLGESRSPYLQQHAGNPVAWWQWGDEAFAAARAEDKPIFLSVGYSTCHWCHVMAHESFEDAEVAKALNDAFVCIKVDREERPDVDMTYMAVCQALTGGGGWPLNVIMTPDLQPFWAGTYLPKRGRFGRAGVLEIAPRVSQLWRSRREDVVADAKRLADALSAVERDYASHLPAEIDVSVLEKAGARLEGTFDAEHGGFGGAPKFPSPHVLGLLTRSEYHHVGSKASLHMVERTLTAMRNGGIYDHLGFGFHRYSTDDEWAIPHYEKMLYDQAGIAMALVEAAQLTRAPQYAEWALETFEYCQRDLAGAGAAAGAYYAAEDADSEGVEGRFYTWTLEQLRGVLGAERAERFARVYNVRADAPEPETLRLTAPVPREIEREIREDREALFAARSKRVRPHRDENVLADWNAFFAVALARAARALAVPDLAARAAGVLSFITTRMRNPENGHLYHHFNNGVAAVEGNLDDYAFTVWALCELYMATFDAELLEKARSLAALMHTLFVDASGAYLFTAAGGAGAGAGLPRPKETSDGAMPSGNSAALAALGLLGQLGPDDDAAERARRLASALGGPAAAAPWGFAQFVCAALDRVACAWHVTVSAGTAREAADAAAPLGAFFLPNVAVSAELSGEAGKPASFRVCGPSSCLPPVSTAAEVSSLISPCLKGPAIKW